MNNSICIVCSSSATKYHIIQLNICRVLFCKLFCKFWDIDHSHSSNNILAYAFKFYTLVNLITVHKICFTIMYVTCGNICSLLCMKISGYTFRCYDEDSGGVVYVFQHTFKPSFMQVFLVRDKYLANCITGGCYIHVVMQLGQKISTISLLPNDK